MSQNRRNSLAIIVAITTFVIFLTTSNFPGMPGHSQEIQTPAIPVSVNLGRSFNQLGIKGSILIYDRNNKKFYEHNTARNSQSFLPASTFKIFNSLVALETGVISNDVAILTWDGIQRQFPTWNQDTNIRQAFRNSTVWFYQVLARKIGYERMEKFIKQVGYGNLQIGTPEQIDRFWLEGPLQITPKQQIEFLQRLHRKELPFSQRTLDLVQDIMIYERTPNYILRGKTGWAASVTPNIGWFVGYLEQNNNVYFFATNIDIRNNDDAAARIEVTRRSLKALGLL
ncbi:Penicillin-binding protein, transpeptidase [Trichormus variabilis ATCC 29413]|uniref:beta-lactamase n=2 Tax=Anabaena variabilis TaxID=264691 RepID=Q3MG48_TRIV2|nr:MULTISPECIES: class D beta-lactamase [Nostocaceae]ABA20038.1 Penicillin-binding protein, transpeptidase [Trichormus variabilis ATCC 29413]MBC1215989.1 class D beta-lactamase [Trichormus variabilis ARAD]MBC1255346.1 class D beta-lactamase [Trichormus variabilis V5]MBC1268452.1 class D beta-lactamase [Trichormus variabilis FSR]MBC1304398.1 class D beta-lactamase [Trichormus variabilis N2B]